MGAENPGNVIIYNPIPLIITKIESTAYANANNIREVTIYGSSNNSSWTTLTSSLNTTSGISQIITLTNSSAYKYYKLTLTGQGNGYITSSEFKITATQLTSVIDSITFPYSHSNTNYSYSLSYYGEEIAGSYASSLSKTGISLTNNSDATRVYYSTIGY